MADGVDGAIEVKPDRAIFHELQRRLVQGISVKKLRRRVNTLIYENSKPEYIRNHSKQVPFFIFSIKASWISTYTDEQKAGWFFEEWGDNTLAGFLLYLYLYYGASTDLNESYLKYYLLSGNYNTRPV
ncbi:hypothetical protein UP17_12590 [Peribacillus simplex]|uniref:hypothetical protein n=1 Tax=Peribacillus simplex TaxID=1478 RepID=UPI000777AEA9|nr:hypothetical protein [Peribacillus simplex]AMM93236.1 hypothetical protein UP17_12590 [Peribacillus simplex]